MSTGRPRLGQLLVSAGVLEPSQLTDALRQQVVYGGRLGTSLIELGLVKVDQVAHALAKQHGVPAAMSHHFEHSDGALLELFPKELVGRHLFYPIARILGARSIVVCFRDPHNEEAVAAARSCTEHAITVSVAPEVEVLQWIERGYGLRRPQRYVTAPAESAPLPRTTLPSIPAVRPDDDGIDIDFDSDVHSIDDIQIDVDSGDEIMMPGELQLVELDDASVARRNVDYSKSGDVLDLPRTQSRIDLRDVARAAVAQAESVAAAARMSTAAALKAVSAPKPVDIDEAVRQIQAADHREGVSTAVLEFLKGSFGAALIALVKGETALGYRGFGGNFDEFSVESVMIPLSVDSVFAEVHRSNKTFVGAPPSDAHAVQERFFKLFPGPVPETILVAPVVLHGRMVCLIYAAERTGQAISAKVVADVETLRNATQQAFLDLIKKARAGA